jgi:hypothetical protein
MRKGFLGSAFMVFAGASLALAQVPGPSLPAQPGPPSGVLDDHGAGNGVCGPGGCFWVSAEYLLWWIRGMPLPPLVTTGPASPTTPSPGAIGTPGTVVLFGGNDVDSGAFSGARFTAGFWLNGCHTVGIEGSYFFLGSRSNDFTTSSSGAAGSQVLARPFFDVSNGMENSELDAFPGLASGFKIVHSSSALQGAEANMICNLCCICNDCCNPCAPAHGYRVDLISGLSYLDLKQKLFIGETSQVFPGATGTALDGSTISAFDQFDTRNQFYGAQIGARAEVWRNRVFANITCTVALGDTHQEVDINGSTAITFPGGATTILPGDLLAQPSNIGHYARDQFSVVPELGVNVGYQLTRNLGLFMGYTIIYWSNVELPGDAIDTRVNSTRVPTAPFFGIAPSGPLAPLFSFHNSDFWAQGLNFGLQLRF